MRFVFTMNVPSRSNPVHQVIGDHPATRIEQLYEILEKHHWGIVVDELYSENNELVPVGKILLNSFHIAKVKVYVDKPKSR